MSATATATLKTSAITTSSNYAVVCARGKPTTAR